MYLLSIRIRSSVFLLSLLYWSASAFDVSAHPIHVSIKNLVRKAKRLTHELNATQKANDTLRQLVDVYKNKESVEQPEPQIPKEELVALKARLTELETENEALRRLLSSQVQSKRREFYYWPTALCVGSLFTMHLIFILWSDTWPRT